MESDRNMTCLYPFKKILLYKTKPKPPCNEPFLTSYTWFCKSCKLALAFSLRIVAQGTSEPPWQLPLVCCRAWASL